MKFTRVLFMAASLVLTLGSSCSATPFPSKTVLIVSKNADGAIDSGGKVCAPALKPIDRAALQSLTEKTAKDLLVPGAVVLLQTPQGNFECAYGTSKIGTTIAPNSRTHFRIASNTKTMTAAVILQLAQEGKLQLADFISKYIPGVPGGDKITIANLLEMRSGLYNFTESAEISATIDSNQSRIWSPEELLSIAFKHPRNAAPNTVFEYNNTNYLLLGLVIEKVDGKPISTSMHDRLFVPLGMKNTEYPLPVSNAIPEPYSHGYLYGSSSVALVGAPPYSPQLLAAAGVGTLRPTDYTNVNHSFAGGAGAVISTAEDLAIWIRALNTGKVLNPDYQKRWLDSLQVEDPKNPAGAKYGYGITQLRWGPNTYLYHGGETPGYNSFIGYDAKNKVTMIVWTNLTVSLNQVVTANTLMLKVLDQVYCESPLAPTPASKHAP